MEKVYGHRGAIHQTEHVDVEVDADGKVVAVWFRCMHLPFKQVDADRRRAAEDARALYRRTAHAQGCDC